MLILNRIRNEPVLLLAVVGALLTCLVQFGVDISSDQQNALTGVVWAVLALVARHKVTPVASQGEQGDANVGLLLAVATLLGVVLLLFGVRL